MGQMLVTKSQAEPENEGGLIRWLATGKTVLNNKGKPVKQYEPYFSKTHHFEEPKEAGVTPVMYYDAPGRLIRTELPDGSFSRVEFSPWFTATFDPNTVLEPNNAWYDRNSAADASPQAAARPSLQPCMPIHRASCTDSLGRDVVAVAHNRYPDSAGTWVDKKYVTFTKLDTEGKPSGSVTTRRNRVMVHHSAYPGWAGRRSAQRLCSLL
jgi:hypothetical protein